MHAYGFTAIATLVTGALAGCLTADQGEDASSGRTVVGLEHLSQAIYDILPVENVRVASVALDQTLEAAVYRPDTDEPVPVWINFSPYWGDDADAEGDAFSRYMIHEYVPRGYAVVLSSVRGTGHSDGCFAIGGDAELQDMYNVVDHFARVEWSNGHVGAGGKSYDSTTQNGMIAKFPHPALKTIFHVSGITDMYRYNYREGAPYTSGTIFNTYYSFGQDLHEYALPLPIGGGSPAGESEFDEDEESIARLLDTACPEIVLSNVHGVASGVTGQKTDYWIERDWNRYVGDTAWNGSIFFVHGFADWNVKPDHILPWVDRLPDDIAVKGWLHQWEESGTGHVYPMRQDWNLTMLRWLDHFLKGIDTGILAEPAWDLQSNDGIWRWADTWPPETGEVEIDAQVLASAVEGPLRFSGQLAVTLPVAVSGLDPVVTVTLWDEDAVGAREWRNEAVLRLLYREGLDTPVPLGPGDVVTVRAEFYPQDDLLPLGHKWVLTTQDAPRYVLTLPLQLESAAPDLAQATVHVPWAPVDAVLPVQPTPMACFTC
jgi:predicted acyl esterase